MTDSAQSLERLAQEVFYKPYNTASIAGALHTVFEVTREMSETIAADETAFGRVDESDVMAEVLERLEAAK